MSRLVAAGTLAFCAAFAARTANADLPAFGTLHFGDSFATARAATPGVTWRDGLVSKDTGAVLSIEASSAVEFAGARYDVSVQPQYYGGYVLNLKRGIPAATADGCEEQLIKLIQTVEPQLGAFAGSAELLHGARISEREDNALGGYSGYTIWDPRDHPQTLVRVGEKSTLVSGDVVARQPVIRLEGGSQPDVRLLRARAEISGTDAPPIIVSANGDFWRQHAVPCTVSLELARVSRIPAPEVMAFDPKSLRHAGSIARRHRVLSVLPPLPGEGLQFAFQCEVQRGRGRTQNCRSTGPAVPPPFYDVAKRWADTAEFDFSRTQMDRNDPRLLTIAFPISMSRSDIRNIDFLGAPAIDASALTFARSPMVRAEDFYPPRAKRYGIQGVVTLACQVQNDFSILCGAREGVEQPDPDLVQAAVKLIELYEASPTFPDGKTTSGQVFIRSVKFVQSES
jgi:hypothetical protein